MRASVLVFTAFFGFLALPKGLAAQASDSAATLQSYDELTDLALEDLLKVKVYAASKFVQDIARAPASVTIIRSEEIRRQGYRTLADVLRSVRGFYVSYDRNYSYVGVRGFSRPGDYNTRVLLLINGHRLNDTIFEQALVGTESPLDVSLIERIEVIRGPSSSLYGTSAFFAVVNIMTKAGRSLQGVEVEGQSASQASRSGRVTAGGRRADGLEGLVSVSAHRSDGNRRLYFSEFDTPETGDGLAIDADGDRAINVFGSALAKGFAVQAGFGARTKTIPTASYDTTFGDSRTETRDARSFVDLRYTRRLAERSTLQWNVAYDDVTYDGTFAYDTGLFLDGARGKSITTEAAVIRQFDRQSLTAGFESRNNLRQDQSAEDETGVLLDDRRQSQIAALYLEDEIRIAPRLLLNAGLRWDHYFDTFGGTMNPRVGVIILPFDGSALKALYGRAFRAPNPFELYYDQNELSAELKPEQIFTYEVVWEQQFRAPVRVSTSLFRYDVRDLIAQREGSDTLDGLYYQNSDTADAAGAEFELQAEFPHGVQARVAQTFQSVNDAQTGDVMSNSPRHMTYAVVEAPLGSSGLRLGFNGYRVGARQSVSGTEVNGAFVAGLTVSRPASVNGLELSLSVRNLFGVAYADPGSVEHRQHAIPQDGRTLGVGASWRF